MSWISKLDFWLESFLKRRFGPSPAPPSISREIREHNEKIDAANRMAERDRSKIKGKAAKKAHKRAKKTSLHSLEE